MSFCCSKSALVCFCGLTSSRKASGAPLASGHRKVSAARGLRRAALTASLPDSGMKCVGHSGSAPSCPAGGLCWNGSPPASCASHHCSIYTQGKQWHQHKTPTDNTSFQYTSETISSPQNEPFIIFFISAVCASVRCSFQTEHYQGQKQ